MTPQGVGARPRTALRTAQLCPGPGAGQLRTKPAKVPYGASLAPCASQDGTRRRAPRSRPARLVLTAQQQGREHAPQ